LSQSGFCCAYVYFIKENYAIILNGLFGWDINPNTLAIFCFILFTLLCYVRKIEVFAATHVFADSMIVLTVIVVVIYAALKIEKDGVQKIPFINT
jgi:amino acid permease